MEIRSADGTDVVVVAEGAGPPVLIVHGGMGDETAWALVARALAARFRVLRIRRRLYRLELPADPATDFAREVEDIAAVAASMDRPCLLVGHSSGAVVALEALVALPGSFSGAVLYEPPIPDLPLGRPDSLARARAALDQGHLGRAVRTFLGEVVQVGAPMALLAGAAIRLVPQLRRFAARQIDDWDALVRLGPRLPAWAAIREPVCLLTGDRSPAHLRERVELVAAAVPGASVTLLAGQGHSASFRAPALVADRIADFAATVGWGRG